MMDVKVTDCVFDKAQDLVKVGALQTNMQSVTIENCEFKNGSRYGLSIRDYDVANLKNCLFYNNNTTAIFSTGHSQTTVQSCTVDKNTNGIDFVVQAQGSVKDSIITNNSIGIINEGAGTVTATYNNVWIIQIQITKE